jgi:hypothetical protein
MDDLGPFAPPSDYELGPELHGEIPRPVPEEFVAAQAARLRNQALGWGVIGGVLFAVGPLPITQHWAISHGAAWR